MIFDGEYNAFRRGGGSIRHGGDAESSRGEKSRKGPRRMSDSEWRDDARRKGFGGKEARSPRKGGSKPRSEEKFASSKGHFADKPRRDDRRDDRRDNRFADRRSERFSRDRQSAEERQPSENPLAVRRNEQALKMLRDKKPSLPPGEKTEGGVVMRSRRGWKKNDD